VSQQNVEIVRGIYERWGRGDFRAGVELYDPHVQLVLRPEFPDAGAYHGPDEISKYMREDFLADLEDAVILGEEFLDAGDSVLVRVNQVATGPGSGARVGIRYYQVWTFRGRSVIRIESVREREEALEAAGLAAQPDQLMLETRRVLPAARPVVFAAFSDPGELAKWWGPEGFTVPSLEFDPRVGDSYRIEMQPPEGDRFHLRGEFREVDPPNRLAFTFVWEPPDPDDVETLVELSFRDLGQSTEVAFTQGPFKTEDRRALHRDGWADSFDKLERLISAQG
jgi:uncharacterized protein YndB with AHSA1/START domain/ketosteroid isomerase-like protein